jgi:pantoate--beta-alanine ligase
MAKAVQLDLKHPLAFVPTMGALHGGHLSLIEIANTFSSEVLISIFVNPLQFENSEDLAKYPRPIELDIKLAESAGATFVWAPTFDEIYPSNPTIIPAGEIGNTFEGVHRFGHFDGVLTVVKRLFELVKPEYAIFGEKDFQQLFLIKKMVAELKLPIQIIAAPIIRESDGLAMSSRNVRLSESDRSKAVVIAKALREATLKNGIAAQRSTLAKVLASEPDFIVDYAEIIDEASFLVATEESVSTRAIVAGWLSGVRLLDNMQMRSTK